MLSYRHSFHAGNFADVIKHIVIIEILEHLINKDNAFDYIDTHAGAGYYNLDSDQAAKLREYSNGIGKLKAKDWPELARYFEIIKKCNSTAALKSYPGSPIIAMHFMRAKDRAWLFEMHPKDVERLKKSTAKNRRIRVADSDGFKGMLSLLPPASRRGLVLIDPSYEIKTDYTQVFDAVAKAYKKFTTGTYAIWYPVVERKRIDQLEKKFISSGIKRIQRFELAVTADSFDRGMTAAGMMVINPPWMLMEKMSQLLPKLVKTLAEDEGGFYKADVLVGE